MPASGTITSVWRVEVTMGGEENLRRAKFCVLPVIALLAVGFALTGCKSKPVGSAAASDVRPMSPMPEMLALNAAPRLVCPPIDSSAAPAVSAAKGGHRVVLSWKAGSRDSKHGTAVGYCLYRGIGPKARATERINILPFPGTKCVDDLVENGKQYSYVVRAISAQGVTSLISKQAPALIPNSPPRALSDEVSAPMCREPDGIK